MKRNTQLLLSGMLCFGLSSAAQAAEIDLLVSGVVRAQGQVLVALYDSADSYRKTALTQSKQAATLGEMRFQFRDLPVGDYAIALFHDENDNGKLDTNLMGMPKEPFAFSVFKGTLMGPPGWAAVKFTVPESGIKLNIALSE
jgi:uncharacterized protein (DUF2141 family)